ncbi:MAG TPA: glycoside hydrolase family 3 protein [Terracidiphilus sp.]|nr:glycoside hydrolase family 3 protein [Terracidiphilus sp.]
MNWRCLGTWPLLAFTLLGAVSAFPAAPAPVHLDHKGEKWAVSTLRKMTLEEKIGQMILVWARVQFLNVDSPEYLQMQEEMRTYHLGGFGVTIAAEGGILTKSQPLEAALLTNELQKDSKYPLLFAADFERGLSMRLTGATDFPAAMAFGATGDKEFAREFGRISAQESRAIGIQWNWFPVADINSNPANPIINTRSFGADPAQVGEMVAAYIAGARSAGLLTTSKHFPGHGDTDTDSHLGLARTNASVDRLNTMELVPFRAAIAAGVDSVMIGHISVPSIEPDPNRPASISSLVVTDLLKKQLGFHGLVVTDALDMGALTRVFSGSEAEISGAEAVEAIRAGNDMVLIPGDLGGTYNGLLNAVKQGKLTQERIDQSVLKILRMKASVGLNRNRFVNLSAVAHQVARPESQVIAQKIADHAITLVADNSKLIPLRASASATALPASEPASQASNLVAVIFADTGRGSEGGRTFVSELRRRVPNATVFYVDGTNSAVVSKNLLPAVKGATRVIAVAESVPSPRRTTQGRAGGSVEMDMGPAKLLASIVENAGDRTVVVAFGNPYVGSGIAGIQTYLCTFSNTSVSAFGLAAALFGEIPVHGHLPITIPGLANLGAGLDRDSVAARLGPPSN